MSDDNPARLRCPLCSGIHPGFTCYREGCETCQETGEVRDASGNPAPCPACYPDDL